MPTIQSARPRPVRLGAGLALVLSCLTLAGQASAQAQPLRLGVLKGPSGIALAKVLDKPPLLHGGRRLEAQALASADLMTAKLVSGELDLGVLPVNVAAKLRNGGVPLVALAVIGNGMVSLLSSGEAPASLAELRGKEVQVAGQGATPDLVFRKLLSGAGLDPARDLRLGYALAYPEAAAALAAGKIAHAVLPEPFATLALQANPRLTESLDLDALWKSATGQASYPMTLLVARQAAVEQDRASVEILLGAARASIAEVQADPKAAGALVERLDLGLKAPVAAAAIPRSKYAFVPADEGRPAIEALLKVFLESAPASIGGKLPEPAFYHRLIPR